MDNSENISEFNSEFLKSDLRATDNFPQLSSWQSITRIAGLRVSDGTMNNSELAVNLEIGCPLPA
jgi:hypothetical protein